MKDHYTLLKDFLEKHFPAQLPKLEAIKDKPVEVIMMYNMYKRSAKNALKERVDEAKGGQIIPGDYVKNQHGNIYQRVDGKVGRHDAYVRVTDGKAGKKKTGLHDSFKLTLINKDELKENIDKVTGGIPYRRHGNKVIISEPLDDATKERLIGKAKKHGYFAQPNQAGGITITLEKGMYEELKESTINEVKEMTFGAYLDDLDNRFVDLMKAAKGLNAEGSQEIDMRATINQNFTLFRNYISALKKEYSDELNKELTFSINEVKEDLNDPIMVRMRAAQAAKEKKAAKPTINPDYAAVKNAKKITFLKKERAQLMRDMEQEAEPEGGPIADEYGRKLDKIDAAIAKLSGRKEMTYDQAIAENKILKQAKLSPAEYQKVKKLKGFNKEDYEWNPDEGLYVKEKKSKFKKHGEISGFDMRGINEQMDIYDEIANEEFGMDYDQLGSNEQQWVHDEIDNMPKLNEATKEEQLKVAFDALDKAEMSGDIRGVELALAAIDSIRGAYIIEAKATCCHRCGRVHVKGTPCKRPYLKGKKSCAVREVQELQERLDNLKETKSAPKGHYFTKSGNLVKGRMTKDAEERGARKSDPKDKMRSKIPKVTQYTEIVKKYIKNNPKIEKSQMTEVIKDIIQTNN